MTTAECAVKLVEHGWVVGLGSGHAASAFTSALAARVAAGLQVRGVPTSLATARLAEGLGIPLTTLDDVRAVDLTVDGADEVDPALNLIKGRGGALVREKIVAASSRRLIVLVGAEKLVSTLGSRGFLPVEVVLECSARAAHASPQLSQPQGALSLASELLAGSIPAAFAARRLCS